MSPLSAVVEHLFKFPGTELRLESNSEGEFVAADGKRHPAFRQQLRTGQILLLFAELVPPAQSNALLNGQPTDFVWASPFGPVDVHIHLEGQDLKAFVRPQGPAGRPTAGHTATPPPRSAPRFGLLAGLPLPPAANAAPGSVTPAPVDARTSVRPSAPTAPPRPPPSHAALALITELADRRASHAHFAAGQPAFLRIEGQLVPFTEAGPFDKDAIRTAALALAPDHMHASFGRESTIAFTHLSPEAVFHVMLQEGREGPALVVRVRPRLVPTPETLGLPHQLVASMTGGGLWVVASAAGHGATTTLAALAQALVLARPAAVLTVEDPVEYVLAPSKGMVQQLGVGLHVDSLAHGLAAARQADADLVAVSDLEDGDTVREALQLAERGKLVVGATHARTAPAALEKLANLLGQDRAGLSALGSNLRGAFAQVLARNATGGKSLAWELLPGRDAVRTALRDGAWKDLADLRVRTLEKSLADLVAAGDVAPADALAVAPHREELAAQLEKDAKDHRRPHAA